LNFNLHSLRFLAFFIGFTSLGFAAYPIPMTTAVPIQGEEGIISRDAVNPSAVLDLWFNWVAPKNGVAIFEAASENASVSVTAFSAKGEPVPTELYVPSVVPLATFYATKGNRYFVRMVLSGANRGPFQFKWRAIDNAYSMASSDFAAGERRGYIRVKVQRFKLGRLNAVAVPLALTDETTSPSDHGVASPLVAHFAQGATESLVEIPIVNDTEIEPTERFSVRLDGLPESAATGYFPSATVRILDDDEPGRENSDISNAIQVTGDSPTISGEFVANFSSQTKWFYWIPAVSGFAQIDSIGSGGRLRVGGADLDAPMGSRFRENTQERLWINRGVPLYIWVEDSGFYGPPTVIQFGYRFSMQTGGAAKIEKPAAIRERAGTAKFVIRRTGLLEPAEVTFSLLGSETSANWGIPVTFASGQKLATVAVTIPDNPARDGNRTYTGYISEPKNLHIEKHEADLTVLDDDPPPTNISPAKSFAIPSTGIRTVVALPSRKVPHSDPFTDPVVVLDPLYYHWTAESDGLVRIFAEVGDLIVTNRVEREFITFTDGTRIYEVKAGDVLAIRLDSADEGASGAFRFELEPLSARTAVAYGTSGSQKTVNVREGTFYGVDLRRIGATGERLAIPIHVDFPHEASAADIEPVQDAVFEPNSRVASIEFRATPDSPSVWESSSERFLYGLTAANGALADPVLTEGRIQDNPAGAPANDSHTSPTEISGSGEGTISGPGATVAAFETLKNTKPGFRTVWLRWSPPSEPGVVSFSNGTQIATQFDAGGTPTEFKTITDENERIRTTTPLLLRYQLVSYASYFYRFEPDTDTLSIDDITITEGATGNITVRRQIATTVLNVRFSTPTPFTSNSALSPLFGSFRFEVGETEKVVSLTATENVHFSRTASHDIRWYEDSSTTARYVSKVTVVDNDVPVVTPGHFQGRVRVRDDWSDTRLITIDLQVSALGAFTGNVMFEGEVRTVSGAFDAEGRASLSIGAYAVRLENNQRSNVIARVDQSESPLYPDGSNSQPGLFNFFTARTNPAESFLKNAPPQKLAGSIAVDENGMAVGKILLPTGDLATFGGTLNAGGELLFQVPSPQSGAIQGHIAISAEGIADFSCEWTQPPFTLPAYPAGFRQTFTATGAPWGGALPARFAEVLVTDDDRGGLREVSSAFRETSRNVFVPLNPQMSGTLRVNEATGWMSGKLRIGHRPARNIRGVVAGQETGGGGYGFSRNSELTLGF
jgi:hypothetical protein